MDLKTSGGSASRRLHLVLGQHDLSEKESRDIPSVIRGISFA